MLHGAGGAVGARRACANPTRTSLYQALSTALRALPLEARDDPRARLPGLAHLAGGFCREHLQDVAVFLPPQQAADVFSAAGPEDAATRAALVEAVEDHMRDAGDAVAQAASRNLAYRMLRWDAATVADADAARDQLIAMVKDAVTDFAVNKLRDWSGGGAPRPNLGGLLR